MADLVVGSAVLEPRPWPRSKAFVDQLIAGFDVPSEFLECLRDRMELGAKNYGTIEHPFGDWMERLSDPAYVAERTEHMADHLTDIFAGSRGADDEWGNLGAIMFGCMVRAVALKRKQKAKA